MAIEDLAPLIGTWDNEAVFPPAWDAPPVEGEVATTFEWVLGGAYVLQRSAAPDPVPNGHCLLGSNPDGTFTQHYFDSRGVARVYDMTFDGRTWTLARSGPDFSPYDFAQRYEGVLADDGSSIRGAWHICHDGSTWQQDFELHYHRRA